MAEPDGFFLTDEDRTLLERFKEREDGNRVNSENTGIAAPDPDQSPEIYVAVPPCGEGIPARVDDLPSRLNDVPGMKECCIFQLIKDSSTQEYLAPRKLRAVLNAKGEHLKRLVFNIYPVAVPPLLPPNEEYIRIERDKYGRWLCENPEGITGRQSSTSSTSSTSMPLTSMCMVDPSTPGCKYTWNAGGHYWIPPDPANCKPTSSSSTAQASTTTLACLCPTSSTSSTSSTSGASGTTQPCECLWPTFCGELDGDCTVTTCSQLRNEPPPCQSSSTSTTSTTSDDGSSTSSSSTTSCDCTQCSTSSSSTTSNPCSSTCEWTWTPYGMVATGGGCPTYCPCPMPTWDPGDPPGDCEGFVTSCQVTSTTTQPGCVTHCRGDCLWYSGVSGTSWGLVPGGWGCTGLCCCAGRYNYWTCCTCTPPDGPPPGPCAYTTTNCGCNPTCCPSTSSSSTTSPACPDCCSSSSSSSSSSSTSSTSTTTQPCDRRCKWRANQTGPEEPLDWEPMPNGDPCPSSCPCVPPVDAPAALCEVAYTECGSGTTTSTTTSSTSSTSTTTPQCHYYCSVGPGGNCGVGPWFCQYFCGDAADYVDATGNVICTTWSSVINCQGNPLSQCQTTTTSTTTSSSSSTTSSTSSTSTTTPFGDWWCYGNPCTSATCIFVEGGGCLAGNPPCCSGPYATQAECNAACNAPPTTTSTSSTSTTSPPTTTSTSSTSTTSPATTTTTTTTTSSSSTTTTTTTSSTSSTSTTTVAAGCTGGCTYQWTGGVWVKQGGDTCGPLNCQCFAPLGDGAFDGEQKPGRCLSV